MATYDTLQNESSDRFSSGFIAAVVLHVAAFGLIAVVAIVRPSSNAHWGESSSTVGAIQASMVSAIPLPAKAPPVENSVLASENVSVAPTPPKTAAQPPPLPTDLLIKGRIDPHTKIADVPTLPPKHPQPTKDSAKAQTGDNATQLPQSIAQTKNGTSTITVQNRVFGDRYAYYLRIVSAKVNENYIVGEVDPRRSQDRSVTLVFDIQADGSHTQPSVEIPSGSPTLDLAARHAIERVDTFGPLPAGNRITIEYKFDYHQ